MNNWINYQHKKPANMQNIWAVGGPGRIARSAVYCDNVGGSFLPGVYFDRESAAWSCENEVFFWQPRAIVSPPLAPEAPMTPEAFAAELRKIAVDQKADPYDADPEPMFDLLCEHLRSLGYDDGAEVLANMQHYFE